MSHAKPAASSGFQKAKVEELPKSQAHNASVGTLDRFQSSFDCRNACGLFVPIHIRCLARELADVHHAVRFRRVDRQIAHLDFAQELEQRARVHRYRMPPT